MHITVRPPGEGVCFARSVEDAPQIDGVIDDAFGELNNSVTKTVKGDPSCPANFAALYDLRTVCIAVEVKDDKIVNGSKNAWEDDGIELNIDRQNNKEKEYNSDDCRIVCSFSGTVFAYNIEEKRAKAVFKKTDTGYTAEIIIGFNGRRKPNDLYGFDLGINDNDGTGETGRIMWKGTVENETDTSGFGTFILQAE